MLASFLSPVVIFGALGTIVSAGKPDPNTIWQVTPKIDYSDPLYAGWNQVPVLKQVEVYNGVKEKRTYAHHPELYASNGKVYLIYSSAPVDEDSMGQDVWISTSSDSGYTWTRGASILPAALLPNQTNPQNYKYWCDRGIAQRAWQALAFVQLDQELYVIGQSGSRWCPKAFVSAGRVAQQINTEGKPIGDPCWIEKNDYTNTQLFSQTVYGTKYGMKDCARSSELNNRLIEPDKAPAWSPWLYNGDLFAADGTHNMEEQTHSLWHNDSSSSTGGYWQRFWRDVSSDSSQNTVWVEYNTEPAGKGWHPQKKSSTGNQIFRTNIPDARTKQVQGRITSTGENYFISNTKYNSTVRERQPLTIALTQKGQQTFTTAGVLRTNARDDIVPDTRGGVRDRAHGFSYPTVIEVGNTLVVAYSENKENIWVSVVSVDNLPRS